MGVMDLLKQATPFQMGTAAFAVVLVFLGLSLAQKGEDVSLPVMGAFAVGVLLVMGAALQSTGMFDQPEVEAGPSPWEVASERKQRKLAKKAKAEEEAAAKAEEEAAAKRKVKAAAAAKKAAVKAAQRAAKEEAAAKASEAKAAEDVAAEQRKKDKKKKKKKKKDSTGGAEDFDPSAVAAAAEAEAEAKAEAEGWALQRSKLEIRKEKKSAHRALGIEGPETQSEMLVSSRHYALLIGSKGSTLAALQSKTGCEINLPKKESNSETVVIVGPVSGVELARRAIEEITTKGHCKLLDGDVEKVTMEISNLGVLIGPGGKHIDAIRSKSNTKITFPAKNSTSKDISILGEARDIAVAVEAIKQLLAVGYCDLTHENYTTVSILFPLSFIRLLMGRSGERLKVIQAETETKIKVPKQQGEGLEDQLVPITITGPLAGVEKAKVLITGVQKDFTEVEVEFPTNLLPFLIGEKGKSIQTLQKSTNTRINIEEHVWDPTLRCVTLSGFKKDVAAAQAELAVIVTSKTRQSTTFPRDRIGALIGKSGAGITELQKKTNTRISVADHEWDDMVRDVFVEGNNEDVAAAIAEIQKLKVRPPRPTRAAKENTVYECTESFGFPLDRAGVLIGRGGTNIAALQKQSKCKITLQDDLANNAKTVTLAGSAEAVAAARVLVEAIRVPPPRSTTKSKTPKNAGAAKSAVNGATNGTIEDAEATTDA